MAGEHSGPWRGKTALITGASSGIGRAIAIRLAQEGLRVLLTARRMERLKALQSEIKALGCEAVVIRADLEQENDRLALFYQSLDLGGVDVLVNNAGFGWYGYFHEMPWDTVQSMLHLNVEAVMRLTQLYLPHMRARGSGHIINMGSIAGIFPNQGTVSYSASKAHMAAFSTALHRELRYSGVHVSLVLPGPVATEFFDQATSSHGSGRIPAERFAVKPDQVAAKTWRLVRRPRRKVFIPWWLGIVPWVELSLGWAVDLLGPLLLKRRS
jgi:short-subunit dehydrogenase